MSKHKLKHEKSVFFFTGEAKQKYEVHISGKHGGLKFSVRINGKEVCTGGRTFGHANKTQAENLLQTVLNNL